MTNKILLGNNIDTLKTIPDNYVDCCITSPPYYGLRDYGIDEQIGLEETPEEYIQKLVFVFREVKRVLKENGTLWVNIGDSYAGSGKGASYEGYGQKEIYQPKPYQPQCTMPKTWDGIKPKDLIGIPWMLAFALRADGWYLRQDIIWHKPNPMPESVTDRCTKSHEYIFLLSKSKNYYFNSEAIKEKAATIPTARDKKAEGYQADYANGDRFSEGMRVYGEDGMRNKRDVWTVCTKPYNGAHFAVFPEKLILPCILAGCPENGIVLDPFIGSGTTALVAVKNQRKYIGCELNPEYVKMAEQRIAKETGLWN